MNEALFTEAKARVDSTESLREFTDLLLYYDWSNREDHFEWVTKAPIGDILAWCRLIERDQRS